MTGKQEASPKKQSNPVDAIPQESVTPVTRCVKDAMAGSGSFITDNGEIGPKREPCHFIKDGKASGQDQRNHKVTADNAPTLNEEKRSAETSSTFSVFVPFLLHEGFFEVAVTIRYVVVSNPANSRRWYQKTRNTGKTRQKWQLIQTGGSLAARLAKMAS
jgi:hypothetical protein